MPGKKEGGKPKGRMTPYAFFIQTIREEHRKKYPGEQIVFAEFSKKCAEKWKQMTPKEKRRFEELAEKDKGRYEREMTQFGITHPGEAGPKGRKRKNKDPKAPKRSLSAFFFFCNEERASVKKEFPEYMVGDIAKELGKRWEKCTEKPRFEVMAQKDKKRYELDMVEYRKGGAGAGGSSPQKAKIEPAKVDTEDDEDEDDDDDDDE